MVLGQLDIYTQRNELDYDLTTNTQINLKCIQEVQKREDIYIPMTDSC